MIVTAVDRDIESQLTDGLLHVGPQHLAGHLGRHQCIGTGLQEAFTEPCEHCHGAGYVRFDEPVDSQAPSDGGERKSRRRRGK